MASPIDREISRAGEVPNERPSISHGGVAGTLLHSRTMTVPRFRFDCAVLLAALVCLPLACTPEEAGNPAAGPATGEATGGEAAGGTSDKPTIALVMKDLGNEFFQTMAEGARAFQAEDPQRFELLVDGIQNEQDLNRQVGIVNELTARGVDAIVLAPADSKALVQAVAAAREAGIVVINIDNRLDAEKLAAADLTIPFVGPDNRAGARTVGDYLAGELPEGARVAILEGIPSAFNAVERRAGFEEAMEAAGAEVVEVQSARWEMNLANQIASAMLSKHGDLDALLASNDTMALGALAARETAGRDEVLIVGFDNIDAARAKVQSGELLATADQHADQLAVFGIEAALAQLAGSSPDDRQTPVDLVTAESLAGDSGESDANATKATSDTTETATNR